MAAYKYIVANYNFVDTSYMIIEAESDSIADHQCRGVSILPPKIYTLNAQACARSNIIANLRIFLSIKEKRQRENNPITLLLETTRFFCNLSNFLSALPVAEDPYTKTSYRS